MLERLVRDAISARGRTVGALIGTKKDVALVVAFDFNRHDVII